MREMINWREWTICRFSAFATRARPFDFAQMSQPPTLQPACLHEGALICFEIIWGQNPPWPVEHGSYCGSAIKPIGESGG